LNRRFIKLNKDNTEEMREKGFMDKGNLVKYRYASNLVDYYGLDCRENQWRIGIIDYVFQMPYKSSYLRITVDENGMEENMDMIYDINVFPNCGEFGKEKVSIDTHDVFILVKV